ncbi:hypothetical protein [Zeimonas arvi]|uniref:Uncharacterized protein n=1 Tax=Zeimonas arvi TaxID=2498847 RepID=A0A5C8P0Y0_9BURK|nr:hypothetical protein [Zeimonas arvi]TXL66886.1 hypothetical protein FHP08_04460 [Zeimonas arvi]
MSFFNFLSNTLGTVIGAVLDTVTAVVETVRDAYDAFVGKGGAVKEAAADESRRKHDRLREVNDEIMHLRNRAQSNGRLSDQERRRWQDLRQERDDLMRVLHHAKEVSAAEKILDNEELITKVEVNLDTTHVLQYNVFADSLGKACPKCARQMKLQWPRDQPVPGPRDFFWGCTGWYFVRGGIRACNHKERLTRSDYALMMDTSAPELSLTADEFGEIVSNPGTAEIVTQRIDDLKSDLSRRKEGVELATCPVHGEHMVLKKKGNPTGLLDTYFLACPYWLPWDQGCAFIEKLKSGSQLAALLKSETGRGVL